ncbi:MAG: DUF4442 domain-containing protein [Acidobacteria bacterium]|nr:DUF4442 domain-containing protein [Acidobacteriota bacterium]
MPAATKEGPSTTRRRARRLLRLLSIYPPYLGAGVRVTEVADDLSRVKVQMKLRWWNRNYVGTHFGGSLYSMCDPFFMLILLEKLGREFIVWDKAATIRFRRPGRGTVFASFEISPEAVEEVRREAQAQGVVEPTFTVQVHDKEGRLVAEVDKLLYVRRKGDLPAGKGG